MTKHVDPRDAVMSAILDELRALRSEVAELKGQKEQAPQLTAISSMERTLERVIEEQLHHFSEPCFDNPATGRRASSLFAIMHVTDYDNRDHWSYVSNKVKGLPGVYSRDDLKKSSDWSTWCVELHAVEAVLTAIRPTKTKRVLAAFKETYGVS